MTRTNLVIAAAVLLACSTARADEWCLSGGAIPDNGTVTQTIAVSGLDQASAA